MTTRIVWCSLLGLLTFPSMSAADSISGDRQLDGESPSRKLILYDTRPSMVTIIGDSVVTAKTNVDWLRVEPDTERDVVAVVFAGTKRPTVGGGITIFGKHGQYNLLVYVTDVEAISHQFKHFHYEKPEAPSNLDARVEAQPSAALIPTATATPNRLEADILGGRATVARPVDYQAVSVHLQLVGGVRWAENAIVADRREAATLTGIGASVRKGITPMVAIDGGVVFARSGEAGFRDAEWNGQQGELIQTAQLARLDIGGRLRLGSALIPTVRIGVGLEGAWSQFRFFDGDATRIGPDDELDWQVFVSLTAGLDVMLGERAIAGASLSAAGRRSIAGGLEIGYRP